MIIDPDMLGKRVKVWLNFSKPDDPPHDEGTLIGYYDHPSIIVQRADGTQASHSSQLRIEVVEPTPEEQAAQRLRNEVAHLHNALSVRTQGTERPKTPIELINQLNDLADIIKAASDRATRLWAVGK